MTSKIYLWFSRSTADANAGTTLIDLDGVAHIDKGYGIVLDPQAGKLYQSVYGERDITAVPQGADVEMVAAFEMPADENIVVVDGFGNLTPLGEKFCTQRGLVVSADSVISQVSGFYAPTISPDAEDRVVDLRDLAETA